MAVETSVRRSWWGDEVPPTDHPSIQDVLDKPVQDREASVAATVADELDRFDLGHRPESGCVGAERSRLFTRRTDRDTDMNSGLMRMKNDSFVRWESPAIDEEGHGSAGSLRRMPTGASIPK